MANEPPDVEYLPTVLEDFELALYVRLLLDEAESEQCVVTPVDAAVRIGDTLNLQTAIDCRHTPWGQLAGQYIVAAAVIERGIEWQRKDFREPLIISPYLVQSLVYSRPARRRQHLDASEEQQ